MSTDTPARHAPAVLSGVAALRRWAAESEGRALAAGAYLVALVTMLVLVVAATVGDASAPVSSAERSKGERSKGPVHVSRGEPAGTARPATKDRGRVPPVRIQREREQPVQREIYHVEPGDTLSSIAARFGTTVDDLLALNPGVDPYMLNSGQRIRLR